MKTIEDYRKEQGPFYMQKADAKYYTNSIDLQAVNQEIPKETYMQFAEDYILTRYTTSHVKAFNLALDKIEGKYPRLENSLWVFGNESKMFTC